MLAFKFNPKSGMNQAVAFVANHAKSTLKPIHKFILLKVAENGVITIQATNGSYFLCRAARVDMLGPAGAVCVDAAKFNSIIQSLNDNDNEVAVKFSNDDGKLTGFVTAGRSRFKLMCEEAEAFPQPEICTKQLSIEVPASAFAAGLDKVNRIAPDKDARSMLNGVCIELYSNRALLVASDGMRLAKTEITANVTNLQAEGSRLLFPKQQVGQLISMLGRQSTDSALMIHVDNNRVAVIDQHSGWRLQFSLLDAKYPEWQRVVPVPAANWATLDVEREALLACLERARILADERTSVVSLSLANNELSITSKGSDGVEGAAEILDCTSQSGGKTVIANFNVHYLLQAVGACAGKLVRFLSNADDSRVPSLIHATADEQRTTFQVVGQVRC